MAGVGPSLRERPRSAESQMLTHNRGILFHKLPAREPQPRVFEVCFKEVRQSAGGCRNSRCAGF